MLGLPLNRDDTVLDVVARMSRLPLILSKKEIWVARTRPGKDGDDIRPVDWNGIVKQGENRTNYLPESGDRIYIKARQGKQVEHATKTAGTLIK